MSELEATRTAAWFLVGWAVFLTWRFWCCVKEFKVQWDLRNTLADRLGSIRMALELPQAMQTDVLPGAVSMLFKEHRELRERYLQLKDDWNKMDAKTAETKKVFSRALKIWQKAHNTEKIPHLNELVDWLVGGDVAKSDPEQIPEMVYHVNLAMDYCKKVTGRIEWLQHEINKLQEKKGEV